MLRVSRDQNPAAASPRCNGWLLDVPLEGTWGHCRCVSDAEKCCLAILLLEVLLRESGELCTVLLLDGGSFAVELLDVVEPGDAMASPGIGRFEAILWSSVSVGSRLATQEKSSYLELCAKGWRNVHLGHHGRTGLEKVNRVAVKVSMRSM